jgi:ketosteroid isomerase-like protein
MSDNYHTVKAVFTFKDTYCKNKFIDFCNGEKGLSVTRGWEGCKSLECYEAEDNHLVVIIWQKWETRENQESYVKFRHDDGSFDFLGELISTPPEISVLKWMTFKTDEQQIEEVVRDMCHKDFSVGMKHTSDECVFIRPTGNPLNMEGWRRMMTADDVCVEANDLISINKLKVCGNMAYVSYITHGKFNYKGTKNDDIAVLTSVLERVNGKWMVIHGQRSTGRSPSEPLPNFD